MPTAAYQGCQFHIYNANVARKLCGVRITSKVLRFLLKRKVVHPAGNIRKLNKVSIWCDDPFFKILAPGIICAVLKRNDLVILLQLFGHFD